VRKFECKNLIFLLKIYFLAKHQKIKYGLIKNGTTSAFFEKSNVTLFQHMWVIMQKSSSEVIVATNDEGVAKVRNSKGRYAFIIE
jgi:hypothetical protein